MYRGTFRRGEPCGARPKAGRRNGVRTPLWCKKRPAPFGGWTFFTRRCVGGIFRRVHAATKNDSDSFRRHRRRKPGRGSGPFLDFSRDGETGDGSPRPGAFFCWECLLSGSPRSGIAGGGRCGGGTEDEGRARTLRCAPGTGGRETRSAACFYWRCMPAAGRFAAAAGKNGILRWQSLALLTKLAFHGKLFDNYCP